MKTEIEPLDFRYDEGFRGREEKDVSPSITNLGQGGGLSRSLMVKETPTLVGGVGTMSSNKGTQFYQQNRIYDSEGIALCQSSSESFNPWYTEGIRIRKLTPKECWRLMGFDDEDFEKAKEVNSESQLYKQAGNSIVVQCLEAIFRNLL